MRIISKFHDYYDSLMSHGDSIVYVREKLEIPIKQVKSNEIRSFNSSLGYHEPINHIFFCGKHYKCVRIDIPDKTQPIVNVNPISYVKITKCFYSLEHLEKVKTLLDNYKFYEKFFIEDKPRRLSKYFKRESVKIPDLNIYYQSPIVMLERDRNITINSSLKEFEFFKVKNVSQAFQEIEMYISNNLVNDETNMAQVAPEHRKGARFDKWSFRKLPTKRK